MSVQMIENWTDIRGVVRGCQPADAAPGFYDVEVDVEEVQAVHGFANLLTQVEGNCLDVLIPAGLVDELGITPQTGIACRVRRAGLEKVFVHHEHIHIEPSSGG